MFQDDYVFTGERDFKFASAKTSWSTVWMDPKSAGKYYHAVSGNLDPHRGSGSRRRLTLSLQQIDRTDRAPGLLAPGPFLVAVVSPGAPTGPIG